MKAVVSPSRRRKFSPALAVLTPERELARGAEHDLVGPCAEEQHLVLPDLPSVVSTGIVEPGELTI